MKFLRHKIQIVLWGKDKNYMLLKTIAIFVNCEMHVRCKRYLVFENKYQHPFQIVGHRRQFCWWMGDSFFEDTFFSPPSHLLLPTCFSAHPPAVAFPWPWSPQRPFSSLNWRNSFASTSSSSSSSSLSSSTFQTLPLQDILFEESRLFCHTNQYHKSNEMCPVDLWQIIGHKNRALKKGRSSWMVLIIIKGSILDHMDQKDARKDKVHLDQERRRRSWLAKTKAKTKTKTRTKTKTKTYTKTKTVEKKSELQLNLGTRRHSWLTGSKTFHFLSLKKKKKRWWNFCRCWRCTNK